MLLDLTNRIGRFFYRLFGWGKLYFSFYLGLIISHNFQSDDPRPFYMKLFNFAVKYVPFAKQKYQNDLAKSKDGFIHDMTKHFENQEDELPEKGKPVKNK